MKIFYLFISMFLCVQLLGQPIQKINQLLKNRNFDALTSYIVKSQKSNIDIRWEILRDIVGEYQEGIIKIEESVPSNNGTGGSIINNYRLYLLASKNKIFYYNYTNTFYKNIGAEKYEKNEGIIDNFKDNTEYTDFEKYFKQTYGNSLDTNDLFLTSVTYGQSCGIAGINPEYLDKLNSLLVRNDISEIRRWLSSANSEKQLYAIRGYRVLISQGYTATEEEKKIIATVLQKKGLVSTCSGCEVMDENFQDVISTINSTPIEYITPKKMNSLYLTSNNQKNKTTNRFVVWGLISLVCVSVSVMTFSYFARRKKKGLQ